MTQRIAVAAPARQPGPDELLDAMSSLPLLELLKLSRRLEGLILKRRLQEAQRQSPSQQDKSA